MKVEVKCGAPECGAVFDSLDKFYEHWKQVHLIYYGPDAFGCHSTITYHTSEGRRYD